MHAAYGHHGIAFLELFAEFLGIFLAFLLGPYHEEIHHHEHAAHHQEKRRVRTTTDLQ